MREVELAALAVEASSGAPLVVLREQDEPHRLLTLFIGVPEAAAIAFGVSGETPPRPLTHDLTAALVESLGGHLDAVEVTELRDGSYVAALAVRGPAGEHRLDTRPSDGIALAVRLGAPMFVAEAVLDEAGTLPEAEIDEDAIDAAVDEFRSFLDDVDPAEFRG
jgi:bifunctional DNase/RNase